MKEDTKIAIITIATIVAVAIIVMIYYQSLAGRPGRIVIPAGGTYLGPNAPK